MPIAIDHVASFRVLYACHRDDVWRYLRRRTDHDVAEDLTTEVFVIAWRRRPDLTTDALPWLYGVARRVLANHRRGDGRAGALIERAGRDARVAEARPSRRRGGGAEATAGGRPRGVAARRLGGTDERRGRRVLGCRASAARVRLHRARKRLRVALEPHDPAHNVTTLEPTP